MYMYNMLINEYISENMFVVPFTVGIYSLLTKHNFANDNNSII